MLFHTAAAQWLPFHCGKSIHHAGSLSKSHNKKILHYNKYSCEGAVEVNWTLDPAVQLGSSHSRGHCIVFLGKTLYSHSTSLSSQVYKWVKANLMLG